VFLGTAASWHGKGSVCASELPSLKCSHGNHVLEMVPGLV